jgi:hypothetical protein
LKYDSNLSNFYGTVIAAKEILKASNRDFPANFGRMGKKECQRGDKDSREVDTKGLSMVQCHQPRFQTGKGFLAKTFVLCKNRAERLEALR